MRSYWWPLLLVLVLTAASCAGMRSRTPDLPQEPSTLEVRNQNFLDMNVFAVRGSQRSRMGTVPGFSTRTFRIPAALVYPGAMLRFEFDPVGSRTRPITQELSVNPGTHYQITIPYR